MIQLIRKPLGIDEQRLKRVALNIINGMRKTRLYPEASNLLNDVNTDVLSTLTKIIEILKESVRLCQK